MTINTTIVKRVVNGNGAATVFSFSPTVIPDPSWIQVWKRGAGGGEALLTQGGGTAQYEVIVAEYPGTGSIRYPTTGSLRLESGEKLSIVVRPPLLQPTEFENQGGYFPEVVEESLDRLTQTDQSQQEQIERSLKLPIDTPTNVNSQLPLPEPFKYLRWSSDATQLINVDGTGDGGGGGDPDPEPEPPAISGTILLADGSAGAPSHSFENDPDTGMWVSPDAGLRLGADGNGTMMVIRDGDIAMATDENNGYPALRVISTAGQTKRVNITGSTGSDTPSIRSGGASPGNTSLLIGAEPGGQGRLDFAGVSVFGIQATEYGILKDNVNDQTPALETLMNWVSTTYGGGTILFQSGDYYFKKACNIPSNITLKGEGRVRFMMGKLGVIRCAGNYAFDETYPNARLRSGTASGTNVWHIDTDHSGGVISRFATGSKWRVRGAGGGDIEVRDRIDVTVASTDGVDDVTTVQNADVTYLVSWDPDVFPEAAAYEALYGQTDYTYMDKFAMTLLLNDADRGINQTINIATSEAAPYTVGGYYILSDDEEEVDIAGTLKNRGNIEIVYISKKEDMGSNVTKLTLAQPVSRTFKVTKGAALFQVAWTVNIRLENIDFCSYEVPNPAPSSRVPVVEFRYTINCEGVNLKYNGMSADDMGRRGNIFRVYYCVHAGFTDCMGSHPRYSGSGEGYIFSIYNSRDAWVDRCAANKGRHNYLTQVGTDVRFTNCVSYDCLISDFDCHGVNEVGIVISDCIIKQSELRSDGANTSVAAIRLGNTAHPLGCRDITISNINIFGNGNVEQRGIDIVPPATDIHISNVYMYGVYDGIYSRSNLDEDLVSRSVRISNVKMRNVVRYGVALLGDADAGFTGYQLADFSIDGLTVRGTNRAIIAHEVDGLKIKNVDVVGIDPDLNESTFDFDDVLKLDMQTTSGRNCRRGWSLTDCVNAFVRGGSFENHADSSILVDNGGNTDMEFSINPSAGSYPRITTNSQSTGRIIDIPGRQRGKVMDDVAYTLLREDLGNTLVINSTAASGNMELTVPLAILRSVETAAAATEATREMGVFNIINIGTDDVEILGEADVTIVLPGGWTVLAQGKRATATIVRTGAATLSVYVTEG